MKRLLILVAIPLFAESPKPETFKPSPELRQRIADLDTEQQKINAEEQALIARQKAVVAQAEEIRVRVCWESSATPAECGQWSNGEVLKIPKQDV